MAPFFSTSSGKKDKVEILSKNGPDPEKKPVTQVGGGQVKNVKTIDRHKKVDK